MFVQAYINTSKEIFKIYSGQEPFSSFLKKFFRENKKFGSRDRKQIAHLCYCVFRLGKSLKTYRVEEKFAIAVYLCDKTPSQVLEYLKPEWNKNVADGIEERIKLVKEEYQLDIEEIFPWRQHLSSFIKYDLFVRSFLIQPDIYLRLRPGKEMIVQQKLSQAKIPFEVKNNHCIAVAPASKLDEILVLNSEAVIQDINSQKVIEPLIKHVPGRNNLKTAWDCCAASGGKSILLADHFPGIQLTVSDIRESILINLTNRFLQAGITGYRKMVADIAATPLPLNKKFDLIVCDAPCSGSGTWSRTPEQLYFFDEGKIEYYSSLQKKIVTNAVKNLRNGSYFLYITCSVFKEENEDVTAFIEEKLSVQLLEMQYFTGYNDKADTLFAALFIA